MYKKREISSVRELLKKSSNKELESKFLTKFNNSIVIPKEYKIIKFTDSFFRASYDPNNSDDQHALSGGSLSHLKMMSSGSSKKKGIDVRKGVSIE